MISFRHVTLAVALVACAATLGLAGCGSGGTGTPRVTPTPPPCADGTTTCPQPQPGWTVANPANTQPTKKWTILVYLNGANDLEADYGFGTLNVNQMEQIGTNADINIVVQFKRIKGQYNDASDGNWSGLRRYLVTNDTDSSRINSVLLSQRASLDMGSPQTLQDFIQWGLATYPAQKYCLVIWNHGAGWRAQKLPSRATTTKLSASHQNSPITRGVSYDDEFGTHIDTIQIPAAMDMGGGRKWDLLTFDASLMQMAEVAYEIRDKASYIVGSEESPPGEGYPYDAFLRDLAGNPGMNGRALGIDIAQQMMNKYGTNSDITQSVLDTSKVAAIVPAVDALGSALLAVKSTYGAAISAARDDADTYAYQDNHDLLDFVHLLVVPDSRVQNAIQQVRDAVNAAVQFNGAGSQHSGSHGVAIFLPTPSRYRTVDIEQADGFGQRYGALSFAKAAPNWQSFLINGPQ